MSEISGEEKPEMARALASKKQDEKRDPGRKSEGDVPRKLGRDP